MQVGIYNGETYSRAEINDQKAIQIRGTVRPLPAAATLRGLRLTAFYDADSYVRDGDRKRFIAAATFEHKYVNAAVQYLDTKDRPSITRVALDGRDIPCGSHPNSLTDSRRSCGTDNLQPDEDVDGHRRRTIAGLAYWLPHQGSVRRRFCSITSR